MLTDENVLALTPSSESRSFQPELVVRGKLIRVASIKDEDWIETLTYRDPGSGIAMAEMLRADLFTFADPLGTTRARFPNYHLEWDNFAIVPITTFKEWWENRVPQETRKNVRRSQRRGVTVQRVNFSETLIEGIKAIYDEVPFRQGRRFWHYGKDLQTITRENSSYLERSDFFGAYFEGRLIGFLKVVYVGNVARIMQILSMNRHFDKRPTNALLAKAVERCCERGVSFFAYGKYIYGNKRNSPITEFKRRNGFEELRVPRYFVPLTKVGKLALACGLHLDVRDRIPERITDFLLRLRTTIYTRLSFHSSAPV